MDGFSYSSDSHYSLFQGEGFGNVNQEPYRYVLDELYRATDLSTVFSHPDWSGFAVERRLADAHPRHCMQNSGGANLQGCTYEQMNEYYSITYLPWSFKVGAALYSNRSWCLVTFLILFPCCTTVAFRTLCFTRSV